MIARQRKPKKCSVCGSEYSPRTSGQKACSLPCALKWARETELKRQERLLKEDLAFRREKLKTTADYRREAQREFNRYIRVRDCKRPCVSCRQPAHIGQRHASHYRSRAAAPQLAFNVFNVVASCAQCNAMKSGNIVEYRKELINRIGRDRVEALENNNAKANHTVDYLKRVRDVFKRKAKLYERLRVRNY